MSTIESTTQIPSGTWNADTAHSQLDTAVKHMGIATVHGQFTQFEATLEGGEDSVLRGTIEMASVTSNDENRDAHLKSPDFFDVEKYPQATFELKHVAEGRGVAELTLKGVTKPVDVTISVNGAGTDPWGNERVGVDVEGVIDRTDFGVNWNAPLPAGGFLVADKVKLSASLSFTKAA